MELTVGLFPLFKLGVAVAFLIILAFLLYYRKRKAYYIVAILGLVVMIVLSYVKYDGTNSVSHNARTEAERTALYEEAQELAGPVIEQHKLTFKERMAEEAARSQTENQQINKELK